MNKGFALPIVIIGIIAIITTVGIGIVTGTFVHNIFKPKPSQTVGTKETEISTPTVSKTTEVQSLLSRSYEVPLDWKIFKDPEKKISLKYPPSMILETGRSSEDSQGNKIAYLYNQDIGQLSSGVEERLRKDPLTEDILPDDYVEILIMDLTDESIQTINDPYPTAMDWFNALQKKEQKAFNIAALDLQSAEEIVFNGKPAVYTKGFPGTDIEDVIIIVKSEGSIIEVSVSPYKNFQKEEVLKILSTIRFID